jgi:hypothetical protein
MVWSTDWCGKRCFNRTAPVKCGIIAKEPRVSHIHKLAKAYGGNFSRAPACPRQPYLPTQVHSRRLRGLLQERVDEARKVASVRQMSRESGARGPLGRPPVNVTFRIAKGLTSRRNQLRPSSPASRPVQGRRVRNPAESLAFRDPKQRRKQVRHWRRRSPGDRTSPSRRAGKTQKTAAPLTETLAFRQIVQDPLVVHKPAGCLMSLVFTRGARSHADARASTKWGLPRVDIRF